MFESVVANQVIGAMKADPVPGGGVQGKIREILVISANF